MNQRLVESLAQIIISLSEEERRLLDIRLRKPSNPEGVADVESSLKKFEGRYQIASEQFYRRFQAGELGDSMDFFEWNTFYEMWKAAQIKIS